MPFRACDDLEKNFRLAENGEAAELLSLCVWRAISTLELAYNQYWKRTFCDATVSSFSRLKPTSFFYDQRLILNSFTCLKFRPYITKKCKLTATTTPVLLLDLATQTNTVLFIASNSMPPLNDSIIHEQIIMEDSSIMTLTDAAAVSSSTTSSGTTSSTEEKGIAVSPSSAKQVTTTPRCSVVTFSSDPDQIHSTMSHRDYRYSETIACWYSIYDFQRMKQEIQMTIDKMSQSSYNGLLDEDDDNDDPHYTMQGIRTSEYSAEMWTSRVASIHAVLKEQERFQRNNNNDHRDGEEAIARVYTEHSYRKQMEAYLRGIMDEETSYAIHHFRRSPSSSSPLSSSSSSPLSVDFLKSNTPTRKPTTVSSTPEQRSTNPHVQASAA